VQAGQHGDHDAAVAVAGRHVQRQVAGAAGHLDGPASPASAPDSRATSTTVRCTGTPAKAAARALAPRGSGSPAPCAHQRQARRPAPAPQQAGVHAGLIRRESSSSGCRATLCGQPMASGSFIGPSSMATPAAAR
jgi:hypothetical protein